MPDFFKNNKFLRRHPLSVLFPYVYCYWYLVLFAFICLVVSSCIMLVLPIVMRYFLDNGWSIGEKMNIYFVILLSFAALLALASAGRYYTVITVGEIVINNLRRDVFFHIINLPPTFYDCSHSGEIRSRFVSDTVQIKSVMGATLSSAMRNILTVAGTLVMMVVTSPKLSAIALAAIPIVVIPLVVMGRGVRAKTRLAQERLCKANAFASEQIVAIRTVQAFNAQVQAVSSFSKFSESVLEAVNISIVSRTLLTGLAIFFIFGSTISVLWIGSNAVANGEMTAGTLSQFVLYAILTAGALCQLSEVGTELAQASSAAERIVELLRAKPDSSTSDKTMTGHQSILHCSALQGPIVFDNVSFSYPSRSKILATNKVSFSVEPGETVAIVGSSGAGKSTLFSLLLRFYDPQKGSIFLDGVDLRNRNLNDLRAQIAYVAQEVVIFDTTLRQNIAFGKENSTCEEIIQVSRAANIYDFIVTLPEGMESRTGEGGIMLSFGQKQRIAIARALLCDKPILLLDEATSALDAESERLVQAALEKLMKNRTTLVIAHRLATFLKADRILVMERGKIVEEGNHRTLVKKNGIYAHLAKLQFSASEHI